MKAKRIKRRPKKPAAAVAELQCENHVEGLRWSELFRGEHRP